jgi:hypothetical protein
MATAVLYLSLPESLPIPAEAANTVVLVKSNKATHNNSSVLALSIKYILFTPLTNRDYDTNAKNTTLSILNKAYYSELPHYC